MTTVLLDVPDYDPATGIRCDWDDGFRLTVQVSSNVTVIGGNAAGLRSLARHLLTLAQDDVPAGSHFHLDGSNSLEDDSVELIVEKLRLPRLS